MVAVFGRLTRFLYMTSKLVAAWVVLLLPMFRPTEVERAREEQVFRMLQLEADPTNPGAHQSDNGDQLIDVVRGAFRFRWAMR